MRLLMEIEVRATQRAASRTRGWRDGVKAEVARNNYLAEKGTAGPAAASTGPAETRCCAQFAKRIHAAMPTPRAAPALVVSTGGAAASVGHGEGTHNGSHVRPSSASATHPAPASVRRAAALSLLFHLCCAPVPEPQSLMR